MTRKRSTAKAQRSDTLTVPVHSGRYKFVGFLFTICFVGMILRAIFLQVVDTERLQKEGNARYLRVKNEMPTRGMILDRKQKPLAISTPVDTIWAHPPSVLSKQKEYSYAKVARLLGMDYASFIKKLKKNRKRQFMYIKRHIPPSLAQQIMDLGMPGINAVREYKRYYPAGPVFGHVLGFTNIDSKGQEGVELSFDAHLKGKQGKTSILQDKAGNVIEYVEQLSRVEHGEDVQLSIDSDIQYLAYRHLQAAVKEHKAKSASLVMLDAKTGEILAMVSAPDFNPNDRSDLKSSRFRNRAITDAFEPGSTMKTFAVAMALEKKAVTPETRIDTEPGYLYIGKKRINDTQNSGEVSVAEVIQESSNVGVVKIVMQLPARELFETYRALDFGKSNNLKVFGETKGVLVDRKNWRPIEHATLSYGYGLSVNTLQLARAYQSIANGGVMLPATILPVSTPPKGKRVFSAKTAQQITDMLELVVSKKGTGRKAQVDNYRIAGKTGTAHRVVSGKYQEDSYMSVFAGFAPASDPDIVVALVINDPRGVDYSGGMVAAPVFAKIVEVALRFRNVSPDNIRESHEVKAQANAHDAKYALSAQAEREKAGNIQSLTIKGGNDG